MDFEGNQLFNSNNVISRYELKLMEICAEYSLLQLNCQPYSRVVFLDLNFSTINLSIVTENASADELLDRNSIQHKAIQLFLSIKLSLAPAALEKQSQSFVFKSSAAKRQMRERVTQVISFDDIDSPHNGELERKIDLTITS